MSESKMKYLSKFTKDGNTFYRIRKSYDKKEYQIFQSPSKEITLRVYKECQEVGWEKESLLQIRDHYRKHRPIHRENQYIALDDKGGYRIIKWGNGRVRYYGKSHYYPEAVKIRDYLVRNNWKKPVLHKRCVSPNKYLQRMSNGRYQIKYNHTYYGTYDTYKEAVQKRNQLIEHNWDKTLITLERGKDNPDRYITKTKSNSYALVKMVDGEHVHFGTYASLSDAREDRDFWESINWDFDLLDLY